MTTLKAIIYFSMFEYPLTRDEIFIYSKCKTLDEVDDEINVLLSKEIIFYIDGFYLNSNSPEHVKKRLRGNEMSKKIMPKAFRVSKFIGKFPFVECVCLSGALSKGYFDDKGDIDFFIITKPNRLWIARSLLIFYKKVFLLNSKKYFCVNYFISSDRLVISEKNRFTATEIITLIPTYGKQVFDSFMRSNTWVDDFFPNFLPQKPQTIYEIKKPYPTKIFEFLCDISFGKPLDNLLRKLTQKKWDLKFKHLKKDDFDLALKSTESVSKHHPQNFQKVVIGKLNTKYVKINEQHNLELIQEDA